VLTFRSNTFDVVRLSSPYHSAGDPNTVALDCTIHADLCDKRPPLRAIWSGNQTFFHSHRVPKPWLGTFRTRRSASSPEVISPWSSARARSAWPSVTSSPSGCADLRPSAGHPLGTSAP
jgi:hypothetical protein